jgi:hypothetical protein
MSLRLRKLLGRMELISCGMKPSLADAVAISTSKLAFDAAATAGQEPCCGSLQLAETTQSGGACHHQNGFKMRPVSVVCKYLLAHFSFFETLLNPVNYRLIAVKLL